MQMALIDPKLLQTYRKVQGPRVLKYGLMDTDWVLFCDPLMEIELKREQIKLQLDSLPELQDLSLATDPNLKLLGWTGFIGYESLVFMNGIVPRFDTPIPDGVLYFFQTVVVQRGNQVHFASLIPNREEEISKLTSPQAEISQTLQRVRVSPSQTEYRSAFTKAKEAILDGCTYQIKLSIKVMADGGIKPLETFLKLLELNPSPEAMLLESEKLSLVSSSPETQLLICGDEVITKPIGGTWRKEKGNALENFLQDFKELSEHNMLVDLERNDLGRICKPGSVKIQKFCDIEEYSHLYHMVTTITGKLNPKMSLSAIVSAILPGGTITGCPKTATMQYINALENQARGPYTGVFLHRFQNGDLHTSILIRTIVAYQNCLEIQAGGGIVADSTAEYEYQENLAKARALLDVCGIQIPDEKDFNIPSLIPGFYPEVSDVSWNQNQVLLINHYDSFSDNVRHWLLSIVDTVVVDAAHLNPKQVFLNPPKLLVYSPGPGHPKDWSLSMSLLQSILGSSSPIAFLGICLGFQMLLECLGHKVQRLRVPRHGVCEELNHLSGRMFEGLNKIRVGRYHSLGTIREIGSPYLVTARSEDGCIMGLEHKKLPIFGLQFHPESFLCDNPQKLLTNLISNV